MADDVDDVSRFCSNLDAWLREQLESGDYPELGLAFVSGWTMFVDRYDPEDLEDPWLWQILNTPGQNPALCVGHGQMIVNIKGDFKHA